MQELTDDLEIFVLLEKAGLAGFDPSSALVREYYFDSQFLLLLFCPSGIHKGCRLFICPQQDIEREAEEFLLPRLLALPDSGTYDTIKSAALAIAEQIISQRNSTRLFFDAH